MTCQTIENPTPIEYHLTMSQIPWQVRKQLTKSALIVGDILLYMIRTMVNPTTGTSRATPSYMYLSIQSGYSMRTIATALKELESHGIISRVRRLAHNTYKFATNLYHIAAGCFKMLSNYYNFRVLNNIRVKYTSEIVSKLTNLPGNKVGKPPISGDLPPIKKETPTFTDNEWLKYLETFKRIHL